MSETHFFIENLVDTDASVGPVWCSSLAKKRVFIGDTLGGAHIYKTSTNEASESEPELYSDAYEAIAINSTGTQCVLACKKTINVLNFPNVGDSVAAGVYRTLLPVTHLEYSPCNNFIFVASKAPGIAIYSLVQKKITVTLNTNEIGTRTFAISPCGLYLAVLSVSNTLSLYKFKLAGDYSTYDVVHTMSTVMSMDVVRDNLQGCQIAWHPFEIQLALPHLKGSILLVTSSSNGAFLENHMIGAQDMGHGASDVSMVCFTSDGTRLISSDVVGKTILWDMATQDPISTLRDGSTVEKGLLGLALGRSQDNIDCVLFLTPVGYSSFPLPLLPSSNSFNAATRGQPMIEEGESQTQADTQMELVVEDVSMVKKGKGSVKKTPVQEADDSFHEESINHLKSSTMGPAQFVDDALASTLEAAGDDDAEDEEPIVYAPFVLPSELQPRFQPSTTTPDDYQRRYLVWNAIGTIVSRDESAGANRIEIKFSNSTGKNKQETFPDTNKFTLAALSYEGSFFATEISPEDTSSRSVLFYHAFPNQTALEGANEDFSLTISEGEGALAVAVGRGWAAVATTRSFLRVFTSTGLQIAIITLAAGPIVSMTGCGSRLAVVYHQGNPIGETPNLRCEIFDFQTYGKMSLICKTDLCLSPKSVLTWIGFDALNALLYFMDSLGMVSALMNVASWQCIPVLDTFATRKSVDHIYWPIAVKNGRLVYALLNGELKPAVYPQPITSVKVFQMPILLQEGGGKEREASNTTSRAFALESLVRCHVDGERAHAQMTGAVLSPLGGSLEAFESHCDALYAEADKAALKIFIDACRLQRNAIATDIAKKLVQDTSIEAAVLAANHYGRTAIAQLLSDILDFRTQARQQQQEEAQNDVPFSNGAFYGEEDSEEQGAVSYEQRASSNLYDDDISSSSFPSSAPLFPSSKSSALPLTNSAMLVSPEVRGGASDDQNRRPVNPFAAQSNTPHKRKSALESIRDLKGSPSPKKASIARESPFAQEARHKRLRQKILL